MPRSTALRRMEGWVAGTCNVICRKESGVLQSETRKKGNKRKRKNNSIDQSSSGDELQRIWSVKGMDQLPRLVLLNLSDVLVMCCCFMFYVLETFDVSIWCQIDKSVVGLYEDVIVLCWVDVGMINDACYVEACCCSACSGMVSLSVTIAWLSRGGGGWVLGMKYDPVVVLPRVSFSNYAECLVSVSWIRVLRAGAVLQHQMGDVLCAFLVARVCVGVWVGLTVLPALLHTPGYLFENQLAQMEEHRRKPEVEGSNPLWVDMWQSLVWVGGTIEKLSAWRGRWDRKLSHLVLSLSPNYSWLGQQDSVMAINWMAWLIGYTCILWSIVFVVVEILARRVVTVSRSSARPVYYYTGMLWEN